MSSNKQYISMYKISRELYDEDIKNEQTVDTFENYYSGVMKKFKEILSGLGVDYNNLKKTDEAGYKIALSQKENVKEMIRSYKSKYVKLARKKKFNEMSTENLKDIINNVDTIISESLDNNEHYKVLSNIYMTTRIAFDEKVSELTKEGIAQIIKDIEDLKPISLDITISEMDRIALLNYYLQLIKQNSCKFKRIIELVNDIRENEIIDASSEMVTQKLNDDKIDKKFGSTMDSSIVIWEAERIYDNELISIYEGIKHKVPKGELEAFEKFLEGRNNEIN
ncbi:hypothetical protein [Clostridium sp.]